MPHTRPVAQSLQEYGRGVGGGLLFSLPLFYTMEVWAVGASAAPGRLAAFVVGTFGLLVAYNEFAGIRAEHTLREVLLESVEEMGLGLLVAAGLLVVLRRLPPDPLSPEALGVLTVEGMIAAVGVSVGTAQLGEPPGDEDDAEPRSGGGELTVGLCGAVLIAANVAPTEEVLLIGSEMAPGHLAGLVAVSLAVAGGLLYYSEAKGSARFRGLPLGPVRGTLLTYAVALTASAALLWVFGHVEAAGLRGSLGPLVVLAFPATIGAAAGRLLLGSTQSA